MNPEDFLFHIRRRVIELVGVTVNKRIYAELGYAIEYVESEGALYMDNCSGCLMEERDDNPLDTLFVTHLGPLDAAAWASITDAATPPRALTNRALRAAISDVVAEIRATHPYHLMWDFYQQDDRHGYTRSNIDSPSITVFGKDGIEIQRETHH